jgi:hypothetical protein
VYNNSCLPDESRPVVPAMTRAVVAAVVVLTILAVLTAGCRGDSGSSAGSRGTPGAGSSTGSPSAVAYSACMRSHGVPNFPDPDPDSGGQVPKGDAQSFGVGTAQFQAAQTSCQPVYPNDGSFEQQTQQCMLTGDCPQTLVQQILTAERRFAGCMRSHGVADWPDPAMDSMGRPVFPLSNVAGRDRGYWRSPPITSKTDECQREAPSPVPVG